MSLGGPVEGEVSGLGVCVGVRILVGIDLTNRPNDDETSVVAGENVEHFHNQDSV